MLEIICHAALWDIVGVLALSISRSLVYVYTRSSYLVSPSGQPHLLLGFLHVAVNRGGGGGITTSLDFFGTIPTPSLPASLMCVNRVEILGWEGGRGVVPRLLSVMLQSSKYLICCNA